MFVPRSSALLVAAGLACSADAFSPALSLPRRKPAMPSLRRAGSRPKPALVSTKAMLDPSSVQYAADVLAQHDFATMADALHGAAMHLSDAAAASADGIVDISKVTSSVSGTGMTKPMGSMLEVEWPSNFDPWGFWMASLRSTIFKLHDITGSYGLSIIGIVLAVKAVTYPLNYKVYASQFEMQAIQPEIDRIKEEYADNPEIINMRTSVLFQEKEVNPLAGCLPILIQFPVFIGLYRTLLNLGRDRVLEEPFLFIPSLMGPVVAGLPTDYVGVREDAPWLLQNWVDGHPPLGWHDTAIYCVLPLLVVVAQLVSSQITKSGTPKKKQEASGDGSTETLLAVLPWLIGWFAMNLPAGCALYWLINTTATTALQVYIKSLFKPDLELAAATTAAASVKSNTNIVTEAEKKMAEQASEDGLIRGIKAAYKTFDDFLGMGLPEAVDPEIAKAEKLAKEDKEVNLSPLDKEFWIKDDTKAGKLKDEEKEAIRAKFLEAKAKRQAKKAAQAGSGAAAVTPSSESKAVSVGPPQESDDGLDV